MSEKYFQILVEDKNVRKLFSDSSSGQKSQEIIKRPWQQTKMSDKYKNVRKWLGPSAKCQKWYHESTKMSENFLLIKMPVEPRFQRVF